MKKNIRILIVEDEAMIAEWLKMEFEDEGFDVLGYVSSGEKAVEVALNKKPEVILMDIYIKGKIDGIEAAQIIKDKLKIPIIFMTGYSNQEYSDKIQKINPLAILAKPVEVYEITSVIQDYFE